MVTDKEIRASDFSTLCDLTATTTTFLVDNGYDRNDIEWFEFSSAATFVPFGSEETYTQAPIDAILVYKGKYYRYFEAKGRWNYNSTDERIVNDGSFCNLEKIENFERIKDGKIRFCYFKKDANGDYILNEYGRPIFWYDKIYDIPKGKCCWAELYRDNKVRIWWDLVKIGLDTLKPKKDGIKIKEVNIDPDSKKKSQSRGFLQVKDAMEYRRIKG